jgi:hypothetical protein
VRNGEVGHNFVGETERPLLAPKNTYWRICALRHKVGEIDQRYLSDWQSCDDKENSF